MKFHLSYLWIIFLILAYFSNVFKIYILIFIMLFIHEMGHVLIAKYFKYEVSDITIFPFGFYASILHLDYANIFELLMIMFAGLSMHGLFYIGFIFLYHVDMISISFYEYLQNINISILLFNLIPIYPLDGSRCLFSILKLFFSYEISKIIIYLISIIIGFILFVYSNISLRIVLILLFYMMIKDGLSLELQRVEYLYFRKRF